jgi:hypothetical protein
MIYRANTNQRAARQWFADCCGASYANVTEKTKFSATHKGIRVFDGHVGTEYSGPKQNLTHIKTRNGNITVSTRTSW